MKKHIKSLSLSALLISSITSAIINEANACACGNAISNAATSSLIPSGKGGIAFIQYDYIAQTRNWSADKKSSGHNHDSRIESQIITAGMQYMFSDSIGAAIRIPYISRQFDSMHHEETNHGHGHSDSKDVFTSIQKRDIGDIRINGIYSGILSDKSFGITFGLKLPTGSTKSLEISRANQVGTGTYDALLGFYKVGKIDQAEKFSYFVQGSYQKPLHQHSGYRQGQEFAAATGIAYDAGHLGKFAEIKKVVPILQFSMADRSRDSGFADPSHNDDTGYTNFYFAPAIEVSFADFRIYTDIQLPIYRRVNGNQLVAQNIYKAILSYDF
jgi:hypothetical protein